MQHKVDSTAKLAGRFGPIIARKRDGTERVLAGEFDNLITDYGLDNYTTKNSLLDYCAVGTGTSTPAVTQSTLDSEVAYQHFSNEDSTEINDDTNDNYGALLTLTYEFGEGEAAGNLSEIGIGAYSSDDGATYLFSRELIRDASGSPTTITVLSDEVLVVTYRLYVLIDGTERAWGPTDIAGQSRDGFKKPLDIGWSMTYFTPASSAGRASYGGMSTDITDADLPGNEVVSDSKSTTSNVGDRYVDLTVYNPSNGNFANGINAAKVGLSHRLPVKMQFSIDPPIMKTDLDELTLTFRISYDRGTAPST